MSSAFTTTQTDRFADRFLIFELGAALYAIDSMAVREIVPSLRASRLPGASPYVRGLMNLRGRLVTVIDLSLRLTGRPCTNPDGCTLVVEDGERILGIGVDDVREVQDLNVSAGEGVGGEPARQALVRGLGRLDDEVVIVLDVEEVIRQTLI